MKIEKQLELISKLSEMGANETDGLFQVALYWNDRTYQPYAFLSLAARSEHRALAMVNCEKVTLKEIKRQIEMAYDYFHKETITTIDKI